MLPITYVILAICQEAQVLEEMKPKSGKQQDVSCWAWTGGTWSPQRSVCDALDEASRFPQIIDALSARNSANHAIKEQNPKMHTVVLREMKVGDLPPKYDRYA